MEGRGLICAEGRLWESQRRFVNRYMRESGMAAARHDEEEEDVEEGGVNCGGRSRTKDKLEERINRHVRAFMAGGVDYLVS